MNRSRLSRAPLRSTLLLAVLGATGCDLPLDAPEWSTLWSLVGAADTVSTGRLLPEGISEQGGGFLIEPLSAFRSVRLGDVCELCTCFQGPVPPLELTPQTFPVPTPGGLVSSVLTRGSAAIILRNELPFDLLENDRGQTGFLLLTLMDRQTGETLDSVRVMEPLPPGDSVAVAFDLSGLELSRNLAVRFEGATPGSGCDLVELDPEDRIEAHVTLDGLLASEVTIVVADAALSFRPKDIELPDFVSDRLRPADARVVLDVELASNVELASDIVLSVAEDAERLFGDEAALVTPIPLAAASAGPERVRKLFVLDLTRIEGAERIFIQTRSRIVGNRTLTVRGGEAVSYTARLMVDLPSR